MRRPVLAEAAEGDVVVGLALAGFCEVPAMFGGFDVQILQKGVSVVAGLGRTVAGNGRQRAFHPIRNQGPA